MNVTHLPVAAAVLLAAANIWPIAAGAQTPSYATHGETIRGSIAAVENVNHLFVADDRGYTDDVTLRAGAAVFSNGVRLVPGERVTIEGAAAGRTFVASRIATSEPSYAAHSDQSALTAAPLPGSYAAQPDYPVPVYSSPAAYYSYPYVSYPYFSAYIGLGRFYRGYGRYGYGYGGRYGYGRYSSGGHVGYRGRSAFGITVHIR